MVTIITRIWLICCLFAILPAQAALFSSSSTGQFKAVDSAFAFDFQQQGDQLVLTWNIAPGYYLYRQQLKITPQNAQVANYQLPAGIAHHDEFYGDVAIFQQQLRLPLTVVQATANSQLLVSYQGCAEAGFCYSPQTQTVPLNKVIGKKVTTAVAPLSKVGQSSLATSQPVLPFSLFWALLIGIGVAFTPCVLPMFPLIAAILAGGQQRTWQQNGLLAFCYVQGMALTYTVIGVVVALLGLQFQAALQSPYLLIAVSVLFIGLALAMFGVFNLQLPSSWQTRLTQWSNQQRAGSYWGVFLMGMVAGLICSPCTTAPLTAILLYIAQTGHWLTGGATLYLYALGMGIPLLLIALFGQRILPRRGVWMQYVKEGFGFIILALPIFLLQRLLGEIWAVRLWSIWAVAILLWLFLLSLVGKKGWQRVLQGVLLLAVVISARPLQDWWLAKSANNGEQQTSVTQLPFQSMQTLSQLTQQLQTANRPSMVDLYAQWCVACREFAKNTFSSAQVQQALGHYQLLQIDATKIGQSQQAMLDHLQVIGLPTILFFDAHGNEIANSRITGYLNAQQFLQHLARLPAA